MPCHIRTTATLVALTLTRLSAGEPVPLEAPITHAALFKNGIAFIQRQVALSGPGSYVILNLPPPVHGTFQVSSPDPVEVRTLMQPVPVRRGVGTLAEMAMCLGGRTLTVTWGSDRQATGVLQPLTVARNPATSTWSRDFETTRPAWGWWYPQPATPTTAPSTVSNPSFPAVPEILALKTEKGLEIIRISDIRGLSLPDGSSVPELTGQVEQPALLLTLPAGAKTMTVGIECLVKGLSWAPSYRLDQEAERSTLTLVAAVRNELADLKGVSLRLISGFPNIPFSHVVSPLHPQTALATFFQELSRQVDRPRRGGGQALTQQVCFNSDPNEMATIAPTNHQEDTTDLHFQDAGVITLAAGQSLQLTLARQTMAIKSMVSWDLPDLRDTNGNPIQRDDWRWQQDPDRYADDRWNCLVFDNPFVFPMTTAPVAIFRGADFQGQALTTWANTGQEVLIKATKALGLIASNDEVESNPGNRPSESISGHNYFRPRISGRIHLENRRSTAIELQVRRRLSGELVSASGSPKDRILESGAWTPNQRHELTWRLSVPAGTNLNLEYLYRPYVAH